MTSSGTIPALAGEPLSAKQLILLKMSKSPTNHGRTAGPTCHHAETRTPSRLTSLRGGVPRVARPRPPGAVSSRQTITIEPSPVAACQSETTTTRAPEHLWSYVRPCRAPALARGQPTKGSRAFASERLASRSQSLASIAPLCFLVVSLFWMLLDASRPPVQLPLLMTAQIKWF
jgi:hypothetical protein